MISAIPGRSIVLVGLMGTGKSSVARLLGANLGIDVLDTDRMVEADSGRKVRDIFVEEGEEAFRELEARQLRLCLGRSEPCVIAAAGGVVLRRDNRDALNAARRAGRAFVVWLTADVDDLMERTMRGGHRPLLDDDPAATLRSMATARENLYESVSDVSIRTSDLTVDQVATAIRDLEVRGRAGFGVHDGMDEGE